MATEQDIGVEADALMSECVGHRLASSHLVGHEMSGKATDGHYSKRYAASRRGKTNNGGRFINTDDNLHRSWFSKLCTSCSCCGGHIIKECSDTYKRTHSEETAASGYVEADDDIYRKMCIGTLFAVIHLLLAIIAVFATYSMIKDLITSMKNPVRSVHYHTVDDYVAPGECAPSDA